MNGISIIVCCYNSALRLPTTLMHIAGQKVLDGIPWEVIVVDNASIDDTTGVANREWTKYAKTGIDFRVVAEPRPGLRYARERGLNAAGYEYIIFCDDDNWLSPNYVKLVFEIMTGDNNIGVLGGCGVFEPEQPAWPESEKYKSVYVNGEQTWAETQHWVYGAGCTYRKSVLKNFYNHNWQQITVGREGGKLSAGEDVEICFMYYLCGYRIAADNRLLFQHFVPLQRQNAGYVASMAYWMGYTNVILNPYYHLIAKSSVPISDSLAKWYRQATASYFKLRLRMCVRQVTQMRLLTLDERKSLETAKGVFQALKKKRKQIAWQYDHVARLLPQLAIKSPLII